MVSFYMTFVEKVFCTQNQRHYMGIDAIWAPYIFWNIYEIAHGITVNSSYPCHEYQSTHQFTNGLYCNIKSSHFMSSVGIEWRQSVDKISAELMTSR